MSAKLTDIASFETVVSEMSLTEKLMLLTGASFFSTKSYPQYGIQSMRLLDGGTGFNSNQMSIEVALNSSRELKGELKEEDLTDAVLGTNDSSAIGLVRRLGGLESMDEKEKELALRIISNLEGKIPDPDEVGCFPPGMLLGATWNREAVRNCGEALGREASAYGLDILLGTPNVNLHRDPRNGRLFEGYSEDPCLVSGLAPEFVKGIQSTGIIANVKHFAANNQETERMGVNELIPERALRELYLPGFQSCVQEGGCRSVMTAYNSINGVPCAENPWLIKQVLRGEWGFSGLVMSDWGAVYHRVEGLNAGTDLTMPGPRSIKMLQDAVADGRLSMETIDKGVKYFLCTLLEAPVMKGRKYTKVDTDYSTKAAYEAAVEGITLLKNNGVLPLPKDMEVSFYGERSKNLYATGEGSAEVKTNRNTNPYDCTVSKLGAKKTAFEQITSSTGAVIITAGICSWEGGDRPDMSFPPDELTMLCRAISEAKKANKKSILLLNIPSPVDMSEFIDDLDAVLCLYYPGMAGGQAAADILFGDAEPGGKLPFTFPKTLRDCPSYINFPGENKTVIYGEGIYVGYRYYDKKRIEPLFPFGFGLSYTSFVFTELTVPDHVDLEKTDSLLVSVKVTNTGNRPGKEVVQVYVKDDKSTLDRPEKELKAFAKTALLPGESKKVTFNLSSRAFAYYDTGEAGWVTEPGAFTVMVGNSSRNIVLSAPLSVRCRSPYAVGEDTTVDALVSNQGAICILEKYLSGVKRVIDRLTIFTPKMTFKEAWDAAFTPFLDGKSTEEKKKVYEAILAEFDKNNYGEAEDEQTD
jgi:beta-glucosidase